MLKIIPKREVSKHLKECKVTLILSYIFNISGTHTLLTCSHTSAWRNLLSCKIRLERCHSRIDE